MKIAQVSPYDLDRPGGVQNHIRDLSLALAELGHDLTIIAPRVPGSTPVAGPVPVIRVGTARRIGFAGTQFEISVARGLEARRLDELMVRAAFDLVHFHTLWTPLLPIQAFRRTRGARVATFHDTTPDTAAGAATRVAFRGFSRWLLPRLDAAIAVSETPLRHLVGAPRPRILPPCTDLRRFAAAHEPYSRYRDGRINILFVGRLERRKGVVVLLDAYRRLREEGIPARLIIAGDGPDRGHLVQRAADLPDVVFAGRFDAADAPRWYASCDIFCAPSLYGESFGIVLVEAMASGKPVVAAANPGYRTLLAGEAAAGLVPPGNPASLAAALARLAADEALRLRLGAWGRQAAMEFDCRTRAPDFITLYRDALARAETRPPARQKRKI